MLYTKKGDGGTTKLFDCPPGVRLSKGEKIFEVLGTVDELNSSVGFAKALATSEGLYLATNKGKIPYEKILEKTQEDLFIIQAMLAGSAMDLGEEHTRYLEKMIYEVETLLPPITSFVIPGGSVAGSYLDVLRAIARRTERALVGLNESKIKEVSAHTLIYTNRLSSLYYALARFANYQSGHTEHPPHYS